MYLEGRSIMTIIPIYDRVITPFSNIFLQTEHFRKITGKTPEKDDSVIFLFLKGNEEWDSIGDDSFYPIGVSGSITEVSSDGYLIVSTKERVNVTSVAVKGAFKMELAISRREDIDDMEPGEESRILSEMSRLTSPAM